MGECILIKQKDLDKIKANHPDKKLLERIKKLEDELKACRKEMYDVKIENSKLKDDPIVRIDPMKMEIYFLERYTENSNYGSWSRYRGEPTPYIHPLNFSLDAGLNKQILAITKLLIKKVVDQNEYSRKNNLEHMQRFELERIANMGYFERKKLLKKYKR